METEKTIDSDIETVIDAIAGGNNVAAQSSFDQIMQTKRDTALELRKTELAASLFSPPAEQEEVPEEE